MNIQIIILAGSKGEMLYPLVERVPKFLLPVGNKPLIAYTLESIEQGFESLAHPVLLAVHEENAQGLRNYLDQDYLAFGEIKYEVAEIPTEVIGTMKILHHLQDRIVADVLLMSGDLIMDHQIFNGFRRQFVLQESVIQMLTVSGLNQNEDRLVFGVQGNRIITMYSEESYEGNFRLPKIMLRKVRRFNLRNDLSNAYCYLIKGQVLKALLNCDQFSLQRLIHLSDEFIPYLLENQFQQKLIDYINEKSGTQLQEVKINHYIVESPYFCIRINNLKNFQDANKLCCYPLGGVTKKGQTVKPVPICLQSSRNNFQNILIQFYLASRQPGDIPQWAKQISSDSIVRENLEIGQKSMVQGSVLGTNVHIGQRVKVVGSIIMDDVTLEDDVMINSSIICSNVVVKQKAKVLNSQVSYGAVIEKGIQLKSEIY